MWWRWHWGWENQESSGGIQSIDHHNSGADDGDYGDEVNINDEETKIINDDQYDFDKGDNDGDDVSDDDCNDDDFMMLIWKVMMILTMCLMITGKGWRATIKPHAKKPFSRLLVTNLLDLANIFSAN